MVLTPLFTEGNFALRFSIVVGVWFCESEEVCMFRASGKVCGRQL